MTDLCSPSAAHGVVEAFDLRTRRPSTGVAVLEVVGEVDGLTAPLLLEAARSELEAGSRALVLDLARVSFCSARCLGTLLEIRRLAEGHGATVRVDRPSDKVRRTADLVHARDVIDGSTPLASRPASTAGGQPALDIGTPWRGHGSGRPTRCAQIEAGPTAAPGPPPRSASWRCWL